ncbi:hypothetical protein EV121DRAFT_194570 [Schizophyllum commune]
MPACTFCVKNMEGITEMHVSRSCHEVFCDACLNEFSRQDNDRFTCPACGLIHSKADFDRIASPLDDIDEENPRNREEALIACERMERRILEAKPDWAALIDMMDAKLASLKASYAGQLRSSDSPEAIAEHDAAISDAQEKHNQAVDLVRELEAKAQMEQVKFGVYREELAPVNAQADAEGAALQQLQDRASERPRDICEEYGRACSPAERKKATGQDFEARDGQVQTLVSERRLRDVALQAKKEKNDRMQQELDSLKLDPALAIVKFLRGVGFSLLAFVVVVVVLMEAKIAYEYSVARRHQ